MIPIASAILSRAYQKLGIELVINRYPIRRSLSFVNNGILDGELFGGHIDSKKYPNLIKVPVPLATGCLMVFTKNADLQVDGWESLAPYRVGTHTGIEEVKRYQHKFKHFQDLTSSVQLFNMLDRDRLDVLILPLLVGTKTSKALNRTEIKMLPQPLEANKLYHYLHIKHRKLVPQITRVLKKMDDSGELNAMRLSMDSATQFCKVA